MSEVRIAYNKIRKRGLNMNWELDVLHWFESLHNPVLTPIMKFITNLGYKGLFLIALSLAFFIFKKTRKIGLAMLISLALSVLFTNIIIKPIVNRPRPFEIDTTIKDVILSLGLKLPDDASFPSGHTSAAFAAAIACIGINKKIGIPCVILAVLIGVSRLYLNVHFPTDVIAGLVVGTLCGIIAVIITRKFMYDFIQKKIFKDNTESNN